MNTKLIVLMALGIVLKAIISCTLASSVISGIAWAVFDKPFVTTFYKVFTVLGILITSGIVIIVIIQSIAYYFFKKRKWK